MGEMSDLSTTTNRCTAIVVDLRTGKNVIHMPDLIAILSVAGYKPEVALKAYGGETLKLARKAARAGCGLVIGYLVSKAI